MLLFENDVTLKAETEAAPAAILPLLFGKHVTYCMSAVARLGVPDQMDGLPISIDRLAHKVNAHAPSLYRVMRLLASLGVFQELAGKRFKLTSIGRLLQADAPGSLRHLAIQLGELWSTRAWEHFTETVKTGEDGVTKAFGENIFDFFLHEPAQAEIFNRSMTDLSAALVGPIVDAYDFSSIQRLADVGGGHGLLLASILNRNASMKGLVYDLPTVVAGATEQPHLADCANQIEFEGGSFFERVPGGCDAYIMKFILHDWSDEHCVKILSLIREQLPAGGRILICEQVITEDGAPGPAKLLDIEMLAMTVGGRERTVAEFCELFTAAGLRFEKAVPTKSPVSILEARRAD